MGDKNPLRAALMPALLCFFAAGLCAAGCATSSSPAGQMSEHQADRIRKTAETSDAVPIQMLLTMGTPTDSNSNRYVDTLPTMVYLFPDQSKSRLPVWSRGMFRFELRKDSGELLTAWEFSEEIAYAARVSLAPGPGYSFFLRFADGMDVALSGKASLNGIFIHKNGSQASSNGAAAVRLGKR